MGIINRIPRVSRYDNDIVDGLIHQWRLTENANDAVGALTLTNIGSVTFSSEGASFNGSNQALSAGLMTLPAVFTITGWIKYTTAHNGVPFGTLSSGGGSGSFLNATADFRLGVYGGTYYVNSGRNLADSAWHYVAFSGAKSGSNTWKLYVDGADEGSQSASFTCDGNFAIGRSGAYAGNWFSGAAKDCRFYEVTLTADQHAALYANGPNP